MQQILNSAEKTIVVFQAGCGFNSPSLGGPNSTASTGNGPSAVAVDPSSNLVYATNSTDGTMSAYKISEGIWTHQWDTGSRREVPLRSRHLAFGRCGRDSGKYLYVANSGSSNIFAYKIKSTTGALTPDYGIICTGSAPDSLTVSNDGKFLYASNKSSGSVSVFTINTDGTLT